MTGFPLRAFAVAVGIGIIAASPAAIQDPQQQRPVFRTGANVVRVDVTVTTH